MQGSISSSKNKDDANDTFDTSSKYPKMAFGVRFRIMDAILFGKHAQDIIETSLASIDKRDPYAVVSPGVPLRDGIETPGQAEWTISTWIHIDARSLDDKLLSGNFNNGSLKRKSAS